MAEQKIPNYQDINDIPTFMEEVQTTYSITEELPITLSDNHPLSDMWAKPITVTEGTSPDPCYTATGSINDEFPFNFAKDFPFDIKDFSFLTNQDVAPELAMKLKIDVFQPIPEPEDRRGIKVTVFSVPQSDDYPNGVIVKKGLTFVDANGNPVADDNLSTTKIPEESVVPPEADVKLDNL
ncbi:MULTISPECIES: hypothetical protein [unclassified Moorena]|uniref:hypothetical protein n=1 Tax=unclassified Moorena TaxID=2683338 RepID=UPI0013FF054C|nr:MULTISPECIES: hypothetical protein [unclassified Moorena]NEO15780.1 hypothetical protein [Moorena sp. SIO3E8]NEQ02231.1 hypothetical protein [Moorena sp. SIO3F7]